MFSHALKDSDTESENISPAFCIRWPENIQFKSCIIYRYIVRHSSIQQDISIFLKDSPLYSLRSLLLLFLTLNLYAR